MHKNTAPASHRDIQKRPHTLSVTKNPHPQPRRLSWKKNIEERYELLRSSLRGMRRRHWYMLVFLIIIGYIVYGFGCLIRIEDNTHSLIDRPGQIVSSEGADRIGAIFRDYQIIGLVANNPFFPLEPIATYGTLFAHARTMTQIFHTMIDLQ